MHVALLGPIAPPAGGVQSHMASLADRLRAAGHQVSLVAITRTEPKRGVDTYYPDGPVGLMRTVASLRADVVHLHVGGDLTRRVALMCASMTVVTSARVVLTFHSGGFPTSPRGLAASRASIEGWALRRLHACIAVNDEIAALFARYGVDSSAIHVIAPHARVDASRIADSLPERLHAFFATHDPVFVAVGMLEPEYNLALQIDVLARLRRELPRAGLALVGSGSLEEELRARIANAGLDSDVLLYGNLDNRFALRAIQDADALLRTTSYDGDSVSVREALQLGTPVIASNTAMRPEGVHVMRELSADALQVACASVLASRMSPTTHDTTARDELHRIDELYAELLKRS